MNFSINGKVYRFNKVIKNSMSNFISHDSIFVIIKTLAVLTLKYINKNDEG